MNTMLGLKEFMHNINDCSSMFKGDHFVSKLLLKLILGVSATLQKSSIANINTSIL